MLALSLAKFGPLGVSAFELFDLPYLMESYEDLRKITEGDVGAELLGLLEAKGLKGLSYWDNVLSAEENGDTSQSLSVRQHALAA